MEFKAKKIKIPSNNPFENDKLERKGDVKNLSLLLRNISSPLVLSVNAPWGTGKTTFLEMVHSDLLNESCKSVYFSAWETDFASDPLLAFLGEMNQAFKSFLNSNIEKSAAWETAKKAGTHILKKGIPALLKVGTAGVIDAEKIIEDESSKLMESFSKDLIEEYSKNKSAIESFKKNLAKILENTEGEKDKIYILVDELDRCRPTYSIEFLEQIKHLLDIEGLVFILALDKQQLAHSVRAIYGSNFDALGYLRRFIDIEYNLRQAELDNFIDQLFETFKFKEFFKARSKYDDFQYDEEHLKKVFKMLAKSKNLSLRDVEQLFAKINLVILSTHENTYIYPALLAFLLVAKGYHERIYINYTRDTSTPEEMIELLYTMFPADERFESFECMLIEGFLIAAKNDRHNNRAGNSIEAHERIGQDEEISQESRNYSQKVLEIARHPLKLGRSVSLSSIVERIEMIEQFNFGGEKG